MRWKSWIWNVQGKNLSSSAAVLATLNGLFVPARPGGAKATCATGCWATASCRSIRRSVATPRRRGHFDLPNRASGSGMASITSICWGSPLCSTSSGTGCEFPERAHVTQLIGNHAG
jgi:hypothetical protein